jgi:hypothetical protein
MNHQRIDERSLAFGRLIADRVRSDPALLATARATVARWLTTCSPRSRSTLLEWDHALAGGVAPTIDLLTGTDQRATRLRQSNPFAGVLSAAERNAVLREFLRHDPPAT